MTRAPRLVVAAQVVALVVVLVLGAAACSQRPPVCDAAALDELSKTVDALDKNGLLGLPARNSARDAIAAARRASDAQADRFAPLRAWDSIRPVCEKAAVSVKTASEVALTARGTKEAVEQADAAAVRVLGELDGAVRAARALADTGLVDAAGLEALRQVSSAVATVRRDLDRARAEMQATGFTMPVDSFTATAAQPEKARTNVAAAAAAVAQQIGALCHVAVGTDLWLGADVRAHDGWLVALLPAEAGGPLVTRLVLRADREKRVCAQVHRAPLGETVEAARAATLATWRVPGVLDTRILVSFGASNAWFLEGVRFSRFEHLKAGGFPKACAGFIRCSAPRIGTRTIEAECDCTTRDAELSPSDRKKLARYAWDGSRVIAEP